MPLFGLIKKNKKKTKDQQTPDDNDNNNNSGSSNNKEGSVYSSSSTGGAAAAGASATSNTKKQQQQQLNKVKSDQSTTSSSNLTPVRTISHKTPNPFTAQPVNIPKPPGLSPPSDLDQNRMYSSSPFSTSPQPPPVPNQQQQHHHQQQPQPQPQHLNVVTGQYNAPPTPPSTARSGSIDDKIDSLTPAITNTTTQPYHHDQLKHPQPQQGYQQYNNDIPSADAMIASSSGLLTPVPNANDRVVPSHLPSVQAVSTLRQTKGKYSIVDFSIQRTLGTGSFGRVHLVQSRHNSRFYAIKVLKKQQVVKMKQVEHTNDERAMLQVVKHPFLVNLWGTFQDSKNLYMVMDFIEGGELFSLLRKSQRFPNPVAKFYAAEVALAINYLHSLDIIYRDLKPENLLLDRHGHIKITDFGFAKKVPDITWTLCGTPDYLAPEVVASKGYNKSVDWWSLGILTFEMLAGYPPFYDQNPMKLYENIMNGRVKYPSYFDNLAKDLLVKLLTSDLTKRYGNLKAGPADIFNHQWFAEVNWERLERREIDAPYIPPIRPGGGDASQFERYDEETEEYGDFTSKDVYGHLFAEF